MDDNMEETGDNTELPQQPGAGSALPENGDVNSMLPVAQSTPRFGRRKRLIVSAVSAVIILGGAGLMLYLTILKDEPTKTGQSTEIGDQVAAPNFSPSQTTFTDQELLAAVYSDYKTPAGFFKDTLKTGSGIHDSPYYMSEVKNGKNAFYCTNDANAARLLADDLIAGQNSKAGSSGIVVVGTSESDKFFEIKSQNTSTSNSDNSYYVSYRAYKCSYLSDLQSAGYSRIDITKRSTYLGKFAVRPATTDNTKELVEFLWLSALYNFNMGGAKILSSTSEENDYAFKQILYETHVVGGDFGMRDEITLIKSTYSVAKQSGEITFVQEEVKTLEGRVN